MCRVSKILIPIKHFLGITWRLCFTRSIPLSEVGQRKTNIIYHLYVESKRQKKTKKNKWIYLKIETDTDRYDKKKKKNLWLPGEEWERRDRLGVWDWHVYTAMIGTGALGWLRGMVWGGRWEGGSGWGTRVHPWQIHADVWQNQYNTVK